MTKTQETGWLMDVTNEQHHKLPAISSSQLKFFTKNGAADYYAKYIAKETPAQETREEFRMGTLTHLAVLEPEEFSDCVRPCDVDGRTKAFDKAISDLLEVSAEVKAHKKGKNGGYIAADGREKYLVKSSEYEMYVAQAANVAKHPFASELLKNTVREVTGIARCPATSQLLSCRPDARGSDYIIDVKTCAVSTPDASMKAVCNYGYDLSAAHYMRVAGLIDMSKTYRNFYFMFVSKEAPYSVNVYELDRTWLRDAWEANAQTLAEIKQCELSGVWPACDGGRSLTLQKPAWHLRH